MATPEFEFTELLPLGHDDTPYRLVSKDHVTTIETPLGSMLIVDPEALTLITQEAMRDIAHFLRPGHLQQLRNILDDPEASDNDRFVALDLLKNAAISAGYAYVCSARYETQSTYMGDDGGVRISFYDAPNCTGSYLGYGYLYSAGSPYVTADDQHSEARLLTYFDMAGRAAESGQRVSRLLNRGMMSCQKPGMNAIAAQWLSIVGSCPDGSAFVRNFDRREFFIISGGGRLRLGRGDRFVVRLFLIVRSSPNQTTQTGAPLVHQAVHHRNNDQRQHRGRNHSAHHARPHRCAGLGPGSKPDGNRNHSCDR